MKLPITFSLLITTVFFLVSCQPTEGAVTSVEKNEMTQVISLSTDVPTPTNTFMPEPTPTATPIPEYQLPFDPNVKFPEAPGKLKFDGSTKLQLLRVLRVPGRMDQLSFSSDNSMINVLSRSGKGYELSFNTFDGTTLNNKIEDDVSEKVISPDKKWLAKGAYSYINVIGLEPQSGLALNIQKTWGFPNNLIHGWGFSNDSELFWYKFGTITTFYNTDDWKIITELNCADCWATTMLPGNQIVAYPGAGLYQINDGTKIEDIYGVEKSETVFLSEDGVYLILIGKNKKSISKWNLSTNTLDMQLPLKLAEGQQILGLLPDDNGFVVSDPLTSSFSGVSWGGNVLLNVSVPFAVQTQNKYAYSPDGTLLAFGTFAKEWGRDGRPVGWVTSELSLVYIFGQIEQSADYKILEPLDTDELKIMDEIPGVTFTDEGKRASREISVKHPDLFSQIMSFTYEPAEYGKSVFSNDSSILAMANGERGYFSLLNIPTRKTIYFYPPDNKKPDGIYILDNDRKILIVTDGGKDLTKTLYYFVLEQGKPGKFITKYSFIGIDEMIFSGDKRYLVIKHGSKSQGWVCTIIDTYTTDIVNELAGSKAPSGERWETFPGSNILIDDHAYSMPDMKVNNEFRIPSQFQKWSIRGLLGYSGNYAFRIHIGGSSKGLIEKIDLISGVTEMVIERKDIIISDMFWGKYVFLVCGEDKDDFSGGYVKEELEADIVLIDLLTGESGVLMPYKAKNVLNVSPDGNYALMEGGTLWGMGE